MVAGERGNRGGAHEPIGAGKGKTVRAAERPCSPDDNLALAAQTGESMQSMIDEAVEL